MQYNHMFSEMLYKKSKILPAMLLLWMKEIASTSPKATTMELHQQQHKEMILQLATLDSLLYLSLN